MKVLFQSGVGYSENFVKSWKKLLNSSGHTLDLFQSPEWVASLQQGGQAQDIVVGELLGKAKEFKGVVPFITGPHQIKFSVKAKTLFSVSIKTACILGSLPLLPKNVESHDSFVKTFFEQFPDHQALYFDSIPVNSFLWEYLNSSEVIKNSCIVHIPDGIRRHFSLTLEGSFEDYLLGCKKKRRSEFRRRLRLFDKKSCNKQRLVRIDSEHQVDEFLDRAATISAKSWQNQVMGGRVDISDANRCRLIFLARNKILRAYLLYCNEVPCAFRLGYQGRDSYLSAETGYDQSYREYSPGKVLTLKMIDDFCQYKKPSYIDFGIGYAQWKRELCNVESKDASVYLMRKTVYNSCLTTVHSIFYSNVQKTKNYIELFKSRKKRSFRYK